MSSGKRKRTVAAYTIHNKVELIRGGKQYFELLEQVIDNAKHFIHLQMYIFSEDETGNRIINALLKAAQRGVEVFIVADGYASRNISKKCIESLRSAGIHFHWFNPIFKSRYFYFGRRLHHKVIVADAFTSLVGGVNITNRYNDLEKPAWLDWALYVQGEISLQLNKICENIWNKSGWGKQRATRFIYTIQKNIPVENCLIRARVNDWVHGKKQITGTYIEMLRKAQHAVIIMSGYFLPGRLIKKYLNAAAKRGVQTTIIVAGVSDVQLAKQAERYMYSWLLKKNIRIYEYKKTVLHGKLSTYDGKFVTVGSYNINNVSAYASIELNLDVMDSVFAQQTEATLQKIICDDCIPITEAAYNIKRSFPVRVWQHVCYDIYRIIVYLFTFYFKRRRG